MPLIGTKVRCPSCGAKNDHDATRCHICTRNLPRDVAPSQAAYEEDLYARPVRDTEVGAKPRNVFVLGLLLIVALIGLNYFYIGYGPSWAHRHFFEPGETWRTISTDNWVAILPGTPETERVTAPTGDLHVSRVGVDDRWVSTLDADVLAPGTRLAAERNLYATLVVAEGVAGDDFETVAGPLIEAAVPGAELADEKFTQVVDPPYGDQIEVVATYQGGTRPHGEGWVRARVIDVDGDLYVIAAFVEDNPDPALFHQLAAGFSPASVLETPDASQ